MKDRVEWDNNNSCQNNRKGLLSFFSPIWIGVNWIELDLDDILMLNN